MPKLHHNAEESIDSIIRGKTSSQLASLLYDLIENVETTKFVSIIDAVAETTFHQKREGIDPTWEMNYMLNEWVKPNNLKRTLLFQATFHNNVQIVRALLDHGVC